MQSALIVIDIQNDYAPMGRFPLWNYAQTRDTALSAMQTAQARSWPIILVQHIARGPSTLFEKGTHGAEIDTEILSAAHGAPTIVKHYADSFHETALSETLKGLGVHAFVACGMMTQNCVTHTLLSPAAEAYSRALLVDACTTVSEPIHQFAIGALKTRPEIKLISGAQL